MRPAITAPIAAIATATLCWPKARLATGIKPVPAQTNPKTLYLVDGSGFIFRAYHALPGLTRADGTPVGAVMGFCNMLAKLLKDLEAQHIAVIFDAARKTFRQDIYPAYKAHRPEAPEDLVPQFALIREATKAFGVPGIELEGYEADDLIAAYACAARVRGENVVIVTGDKDLMQLVGDGVSLLDPIKNKPIHEAEVFEKFGVTPDKVVDVQALAGDSVDNVPGVPGIGIKTAAELINTFGDLETLLSRLDEIKQPKRRETLIANADAARISKRLVQLDCNTPLPLSLDDLHPHDALASNKGLADFLAQMGFKSLLNRLSLTSDAAPVQAAAATAPATLAPDADGAALNERATALAAPTGIYDCVQTEAQLIDWCARIRQQLYVAIDTETNSLTPCSAKMAGLSLSVKPGEACYIPLYHGAVSDQLDLGGDATDKIVQLPLATVQQHLGPLLADPAILKIGHNIKFDMQVLAAHGLPVTSHDDTMLLSYVIATGLHTHGCDDLVERYFGHKMVPYSEVCGKGKGQITFDMVDLKSATAYAAEDADYTLRLWLLLKPELTRQQLTRVYERMERPLVPVIAQMETDGVMIDTAVLQQLSHRFGTAQAALELEVYALAKQEFNLGSPKQLGEVLFDSLGLPGGVRGKTGAYATGVEVLSALAEQGHDIAQKVLDWRALSKLRSTYTESLQEQIDRKTGRVHTSFSMAVTSTGRLSSSDPNLQNIPIRTEDGKAIRGAFVAPAGHKLISVDYSQIELRLIAAMAKIPAMIEAFRTGVDIHALTASQVQGVPLADVTSAMRRSAKAINFGIIYGISGFGLSRQIGVSPGEASAFIKAYLDRFPELRQYMENTKKEARAQGFVTTLFGRRCYIAGIQEKNPARRAGAERQAINAPVQGTAADIIKRAMIALPPALTAAGLSAKLILQVHDELVLEAPDAEAEQAAKLAVQVMQNVAQLDVPLTAEYGIGQDWASAH